MTDLELSKLFTIFNYMKKQTYKPKRINDGYDMKKQLHKGFKVIEYFHYSNEQTLRKRVIRKGLTLTDAENLIYSLEHNLNKH